LEAAAFRLKAQGLARRRPGPRLELQALAQVLRLRAERLGLAQAQVLPVREPVRPEPRPQAVLPARHQTAVQLAQILRQVRIPQVQLLLPELPAFRLVFLQVVPVERELLPQALLERIAQEQAALPVLPEEQALPRQVERLPARSAARVQPEPPEAVLLPVVPRRLVPRRMAPLQQELPPAAERLLPAGLQAVARVPAREHSRRRKPSYPAGIRRQDPGRHQPAPGSLEHWCPPSFWRPGSRQMQMAQPSAGR